MNYPVWYLPTIGGGSLIALIAILHVFVSHFAVGGGLYLIYAEKKGLAEKNQGILDFTKRHARFFLLITMVFGSITGVGIWFIIALVNPAATSLLIHNFVFGWAAEWVFFTVEIASAFVYYYLFGKMDDRSHLQVGWLYFFSAWMSLLLINGIIGVMLTPGNWAESFNFWIGFFNPSFFPSLIFRTCAAVLLAGVYGFLTSSFTKDRDVSRAMTRFSGKWALAALVGAVPSGFWYLAVLPEQARNLVLGKSPTIAAVLQWGVSSLVMLLAVILVAGIFLPALNRQPVALVSMLCALLSFGAFEWTREAARRPYVINEVMYSNSIGKTELAGLNEAGFLPSAKWVQDKTITPENRSAVGRELYVQQCYACHTLGGLNNDLAALTARMSYPALSKYISRIHEARYFMPPFAGTKEESEALAAFIAGDLHGKEIVDAKPALGLFQITGQSLFENHCSSCHVQDDLASAFAGKTTDEIGRMLQTLNEISEEMQPFAGSAEERMLLSVHLADEKAAPVQPAASTAAPQADGGQVFAEHCAACHADTDMPDKLTGKNRQEVFDILGRLNEFSSEMEPFAGTPAEHEALANYLDSLNKGGR